MQINFVTKDNRPERLVCEAELLFDEAGPLEGMKLAGFSLWLSAEGEIYCTFPSRAFGAGTERKYFDFLRSADGSAADVRRVKGWIVDEYHRQNGAAADAEEF